MKNGAVSSSTTTNHHPLYTHNQNRRSTTYKKPPPLYVKPGHVAFRLVCHESIVGAVIGRNGSIVSSICRETGAARVHCSDPIPGSSHRVIFVVGPANVDRTVLLHMDEAQRVDCQVSSAQAAVIRVFERVWELSKDEDDDHDKEVYCGVLADSSQVGAVMGKGAKNITRMRKETACEITVLPPPSCATAKDELIQIKGDCLAAKKALAAVSCCLQDCPPLEKDPPKRTYSGPIETNPHAEFFPNLRAVLPPLPVDVKHDRKVYSKSSSTANGDYNRKMRHEVLFRMLFSNTAAGSIIGKRGSIVRALQDESGAWIEFSAPQNDSADRIVTISAMENLLSQLSPAQNAVTLVFARSVDCEMQKEQSLGLGRVISVTARLLVASDLVGCLRGYRGRMLAEMIDSTGSDIEILEENLTEEHDRKDALVQISGGYVNVQNALLQVTAKLRGCWLNEVREKVTKSSETKGTSPTSTGGTDQHPDGERSSTTLGGHSENEGLFLDNLLPQGVLNEVGPRNIDGPLTDITSSGLNNSLGLSSKSNQETVPMQEIEVKVSEKTEKSKKEPAVGRSTYVEIPVAKRALRSVYGKDDSNLAHLQRSGAKVEVCDPSPGKSEGMVIISGKADQVQEAQSMLLSFILSGK